MSFGRFLLSTGFICTIGIMVLLLIFHLHFCLLSVWVTDVLPADFKVNLIAPKMSSDLRVLPLFPLFKKIVSSFSFSLGPSQQHLHLLYMDIQPQNQCLALGGPSGKPLLFRKLLSSTLHPFLALSYLQTATLYPFSSPILSQPLESGFHLYYYIFPWEINSFLWYQVLSAGYRFQCLSHSPNSSLKSRPVSSTINYTLSPKYFRIQCVQSGIYHLSQICFRSCVFYLRRRCLYLPCQALYCSFSQFLSCSLISRILYQTLSYYFYMLYTLNMSLFLDIS